MWWGDESGSGEARRGGGGSEKLDDVALEPQDKWMEQTREMIIQGSIIIVNTVWY